jgi:hypothetical protein
MPRIRLSRSWALAFYAAALLAGIAGYQALAEGEANQPASLRTSYLVHPRMLDEALRERLSAAGATALVVELAEEYTREDYARAAEFARQLKIPLLGWIEVARNEELARAHPEWLAGLGSHDDWRRLFPGFPKPAPDEVVKAWPWVTIWYEEAYQAQLDRIGRLLKLAPESLAGLYLNDVQGAPSSCGCGNNQCRWTQDYHTPSTATKRTVPETPAQFVAAVQDRVQKLLPGKPVVPVWCIECEELDQDYSRPTTGYCGSVGCFKGLCWKEYFKQLAPIWKQTGSKETGKRLAVAAFSGEFRRQRPEYDAKSGWIAAVVATFRDLPARHKHEPIPAAALTLVLQGWDEKPGHLEAEIQQAAAAGCGDVIIALAKIDQSWRPINVVRKRGE